jgi:hypothetical protein
MNSGDHKGREPYGDYAGPATISGGAIDNTPIGASVPSTITGTTIVSVAGFSGPGTGITGIPATGLADGSISNGELLTLNGITTGTSIQSQIDGKEPVITLLSLAKGGTGANNSTGIAQGAVFAGPSGSAGAASFRAITSEDLPADLSIRSVALLPGQWRLLLVQEAQTGIFQRWYMTDVGDLYFTYNASWNNATSLWSQDDGGTDSWLHQGLYGTFAMRRKVAGAAAWNNTSWDYQDQNFGAYSESSTTRVYDFGIWFSARTVGDFIGGSIQFSVEFPSTPTSITFAITSSNGVNTGTVTAWATTRRGTQWGIQSTAFTGWVSGTITVGY